MLYGIFIMQVTLLCEFDQVNELEVFDQDPSNDHPGTPISPTRVSTSRSYV